ncbi:MAG: glycosyltransferase family 2 protein, partial [Planctomycetia bacterium]
PELRLRLTAVLEEIGRAGRSWDVVLVDDGSRDRTNELAAAWCDAEDRIRLVELSRNFGHAAACTAGLEAAGGRAAVLMDGDLQDPPELIPLLIAEWATGAEVVYAARRDRGERFPRKQVIGLFHRVFQYLSDVPMPPGTGVFSLIDRKPLDALLRMPERSRFVPGLRAYVGFRVREVEYYRPDRAAGVTKIGYWRLLRYGFDAAFSFSRKPLQISTVLGLFVAASAAAYGFVLLVLRLLQINVVDGFTTIAVGTFFLGGVQLVSIGVLGEYVARIYDEVKQRPLYIVRRTVEKRPTPGGPES